MPLVEANSFLNLALQHVIADLFTGTGQSLKVHLAVAPFNPNVASVVTDFTEASWTGYAAQTITSFTLPHNDSTNQSIAEGATLAAFTASAPVSPSVIVAGYWLVDSGGDYVGGELFATPFTMTGTGTPLTFAVAVPLQRGAFTATILP